MKGEFGYTSPMQAPKVTKLVVSTGVGKMNKDKKRLELIVDRLRRITGQAPAPRAAKKAIANFKSRTGDIVGYQVTLRGSRAKAFLDKLIHIVFPRTKDFRGLKASAIDEMGNITLGIKEHTVFPETADEDAKDTLALPSLSARLPRTKRKPKPSFATSASRFGKQKAKTRNKPTAARRSFN